MTAPQRLPDADARSQAATAFDRNLVVLAGAGTGKTSLLVERILTAVGSGEAELEQIAAITFTEKAAGEMRQRLASGLERLRGLARNELPHGEQATEADRAFRYLREERDFAPADLAARALAAMEALDRATIQTIHAFCAQLLRRYPFEAGVDPGFAVDTGEHLETSFRSFWEREAAAILGSEGPQAEPWLDALQHGSTTELRTMARALAGFQIPASLLHPAPERADAQAVLGERVLRAKQELESIRDRGSKLGALWEAFCGAGVEALRRFLEEDPASARRYLADHEVLQRQMAKPVTLNKTTVGLEEAPTVETGNRARALFRVLLHLDDDVLQKIACAVAPLALAFREEYLKAGFIGFDGLLVLTRDLLRDCPRVREACAERYRFLLIDEFQDTDPMQYDIVLLLAASAGETGDDPFEASLVPGKLFVVGDAKQSIYRFRGADFVAYRRAIERIVEQGGDCLHLTANFRTVDAVLDPVNKIFAAGDSLWQESDYQPAYESIEAVRHADRSEPSVEIWSVEAAEKLSAGQRRAAEGKILAAKIVEAHRDGSLPGFGELTLLFRALTQFTPYLRALREAGVPFVVDGGREFLTRPEVTQWMATVRAVSHPGDQASLLAFLRSPAGAVSDVELAAYADAGGGWDWRDTTLSTRDHRRVARAFASLREMAERTRDQPVDVAARRILRHSLLLPLGAAAFEGAQRVANLQKLSTAASELARDGRLSLEEVVEALEQGRLADIETDRPLADEKADAVRITSIHRMKGLENRWVIVPDLAAQGNHGNTDLQWAGCVRLDGGRERLALYSKPVRNAYRAVKELEDSPHESEEALRVYYVALTRARDRLTLIDGSRSMGLKKPPPAVAPLQVWGYDIACSPTDGESLADGKVVVRRVAVGSAETIRIEPKSLEIEAAAQRHATAIASLRGAARTPIAAPSGLSKDYHRDEPDSREPPSPRLGKLGLAVGTAIHLALENWSGRRDDWQATLLRAVVPAAAENGLDSGEVEAEAIPIGKAFLESPLAARMAEIEVLGREVPMLSLQRNRALRGSIDLLYRDAAGRVVVADFKTDREADAAALAARYRAQLSAYAGAVQQALQLQQLPAAELWLIRHGEIVAVPTD